LRDPGIQHENFSIRPSSYHTGDPAPGFGTETLPTGEAVSAWPWKGDYGLTASGTTSIYAFDDATPPENCGRSVDPRYDWGCQTYSILDSEKTCRDALAPNGKRGCRACWLHPELRVNYTTH